MNIFVIVSFAKKLFSRENLLFGHTDVRFKWKMADPAGKYTSRKNSMWEKIEGNVAPFAYHSVCFLCYRLLHRVKERRDGDTRCRGGKEGDRVEGKEI